MNDKAINLAEKRGTFSDDWSPKIVCQFNAHDVLLAKVKGEFVWHADDDTDDFFLVPSGVVTIDTTEGRDLIWQVRDGVMFSAAHPLAVK